MVNLNTTANMTSLMEDLKTQESCLTQKTLFSLANIHHIKQINAFNTNRKISNVHKN